MTEFEEFFRVALKMGTGRMTGIELQVPVFVPEGTYPTVILKHKLGGEL
jgi:hypothetical protein